jgi:hypothetical protein
MTHDVFISYSSKDKNVADAVCAKLENEKIRCWIAPRDVPPGQSWAASIIEALNESKVFVLVFSDGSNKSKQVVREVGEAVDNGIPIVPLRIEDVEPSQEMRYYIKSIHWLDAMTPPLEKHLQKLTNSVKALLSAEAGEITPEAGEVPLEAALPIIEPPAEKRWPLPVWATALIALVAVGVVGGAIWLFTRNGADTGISNATDTAPPTDMAPSTEIASIEEVTEQPAQEPTDVSSVPEGEEDWRLVDFLIPNPQVWETTGESRYKALGPSDFDAFAWSKGIFEGDLMVRLDLESPESRWEGCVIVYGGGHEFSYGSLIFCVGWDGFGLEKHTKYHEGENILAFSPRENDTGEVYSVTIEIVDDVASMYVDDEKVLSTFFDSEEIESMGRIGMWKNWSIGDVVFSNVRIKTPGDEDQLRSTPEVEEVDCDLDSGGHINFYPIKSSYSTHSVEVDGKISSAVEWSDATCVDLRMHYSTYVTNPNFQRVRWWIQNNDREISFMVRIPIDLAVRGVFVDYFWPEYTGSWAHSDGVFYNVDGELFDWGKWDELQWISDEDLDPPGTIDGQGAYREDSDFYWFELTRSLNSGDSYDWIWEPGRKYGNNPYDSVLIGVVLEEGEYMRYLQLEVGEP